jgi:hypothetical protein
VIATALPLVLHVFSPELRGADQLATWRACEDLEATGRYHLRHRRTDTFLGYGDIVREAWTTEGDLVIIEHDNAPTVAQIDAMIACDQPCCTTPYWIGPASTGRPGAYISLLSHATSGSVEEVERSAHSSIGCVRLRALWRRSVDLPARAIYNQVEATINVRVQSSVGTWHVHWPICQHTHGGKPYV